MNVKSKTYAIFEGLIKQTVFTVNTLPIKQRLMKFAGQITIFITFIATFLMTFTPDSASAQNFGITGSYGASSHINNFRFVSDDISLDFSPGTTNSYSVGFVYRRPVTDNLRFQTEPSFIKMGARYEQPFQLRGFQFQTDSETELIYLQLPLLIQLTTTPPDRVIFGRPRSDTTYHVTGGIFMSYLIDATFSGTNTGAPIGIDFQGNFTNDIRNQYNDYDGGFILGAGLEYGHSGYKLGIEARFILSALSSGNIPDVDFSPHNIGGTVALYYLF